ncbi:MAG: BtaA family protein [Chloroflexota bacterium]|nr:BtaA family protein [Chloroflexota bacterium]
MMRTSINDAMERIYFRGIVFNQSWEDPAMDRAALSIERDQDTVLTITSGGCNSLNLLCLGPKKLICIDGNPAQTYLMDLKLAGIRQLDYDNFFGFFGGEAPRRSRYIYSSALRGALPPKARRFWDKNIKMYEKGIYSQGKLGLFLRILRVYLRSSIGEKALREFFEMESLDEQRKYYREKLAPKIWRQPLRRLLNSRLMVYLAGMHPNQFGLIDRQLGIERFVRERVEHLLTRVPARTNYFLAQAALGRYLDRVNVPPYLQEANFTELKRNVQRVSNVTGWLGVYLRSRPEGSIDKFSLLDIFDWMSAEDFTATWREVLRVGKVGGRVIYRSTALSLPLPGEVAARLAGEPELARELLQGDRSGMYSSFYVHRISEAGG